VFQQRHAPPTRARNRRAHEPSRTRAQHNEIELAHVWGHGSIVTERK
jgi:hypothetical protein